MLTKPATPRCIAFGFVCSGRLQWRPPTFREGRCPQRPRWSLFESTLHDIVYSVRWEQRTSFKYGGRWGQGPSRTTHRASLCWRCSYLRHRFVCNFCWLLRLFLFNPRWECVLFERRGCRSKRTHSCWRLASCYQSVQYKFSIFKSLFPRARELSILIGIAPPSL